MPWVSHLGMHVEEFADEALFLVAAVVGLVLLGEALRRSPTDRI
jgi:hypothetical protein